MSISLSAASNKGMLKLFLAPRPIETSFPPRSVPRIASAMAGSAPELHGPLINTHQMASVEHVPLHRNVQRSVFAHVLNDIGVISAVHSGGAKFLGQLQAVLLDICHNNGSGTAGTSDQQADQTDRAYMCIEYERCCNTIKRVLNVPAPVIRTPVPGPTCERVQACTATDKGSNRAPSSRETLSGNF